MDILNGKISTKNNNIKTVIIGDLTELDPCNGDTLFLETIEGKKRICIEDETGAGYIWFGSVKHYLRDYRQTTFKEFLKKLLENWKGG